jgi:hypothetical protein
LTFPHPNIVHPLPDDPKDVWQDRVVLCARYAASSGVALDGSRDRLRRLANRLAGGLAGVHRLDECRPEPYDRALARIAVRNGAGVLRISVEDDTLVISGDCDALLLLSRNLSFFVNDSDPSDALAHLHIEWYAGNQYIAEDSEPLVVSYKAA